MTCWRRPCSCRSFPTGNHLLSSTSRTAHVKEKLAHPQTPQPGTVYHAAMTTSGRPLLIVLLSLLVLCTAFAQGERDTTGSGFPDATLIRTPGDRQAFRLWFAAIA